MNELHFGDNLDVLRSMPAESIDLIYLDPPFNSNANYNVLYGTKHGGASKAQSHAFEDTWTWGRDAQRALDETAERHLEAGSLLDAFQKVFGNSNMMAYLAMMTVRLIEMRRVLNPTGTLYLHCDPTASHYLKIILDAIFGSGGYINEISWRRTTAKADYVQGATHFPRVRDIILRYAKDPKERQTFNQQFTEYDQEYLASKYRHLDKDGRLYRLDNLTGPGGAAKGNAHYEVMGIKRYWRYSKEKMDQLIAEGRIIQTKPGMVPQFKRYLDEMPGVPVSDDWDNIRPINSQAQERLGYSTQKPLALLKRIIQSSSNEGDIILDPFCGCGTAIEAAQNLNRRWIGIDVTYLAIHVIEGRLLKAFGPSIKGTYKLYGRPEDAEDARALAARDWLEFQKWAVFTLDGLPKDRPGADGGIDGIIRYHQVGKDRASRAIVSVKGGLNVGVDAIHKLKSVVKREEAEIGVLVCVNPPTGPMLREAASEGETGPSTKRVPRIQIVTIEQLFQSAPVLLPGMVDPPEVLSAPASPAKRGRKRVEGQTEMLFPIEGAAEAPKRKGNRPIRAVEIEVTRSAYTRKTR
ncbi:DNA methyltransferase [Mesorhizobium sp. B2-5-7]|uniref:site-specific DNA-methyltransferase n=1 Tax=Mesorhizobium sp. B2-5-7 TaxID=2589923 RepID=UPI00112B3C27|nr:DNA methyltransferase [Mesorhizobium sp. B2-5-7]TPK10081.1 site-specific DNA-methyltransferase [Mesorhizobium sp. B2-5-7]